MSDAHDKTPLVAEPPILDEPIETNVQPGEELDEAVIIRWVIIAAVASFLIGAVFMVINAHYSPY